MDTIFKRRSIRKFTDKPVSRELIDKLLAAAVAAPSAKNRQPWRFAVYSGEQKNALLGEIRRGLEREKSGDARLPLSADGLGDAFNTLRIMEQAQVIIMVLGSQGMSPFETYSPDRHVYEVCDVLSIGAAVENLLLAATELGLGSLWIANTCYAYEELAAFMGTDRMITGAVALGYPAETPSARPRKSIDEVTEYKI